MDTYHAAYWSSDPSRFSSSEEEEECRYSPAKHSKCIKYFYLSGKMYGVKSKVFYL